MRVCFQSIFQLCCDFFLNFAQTFKKQPVRLKLCSSTFWKIFKTLNIQRFPCNNVYHCTAHKRLYVDGVDGNNYPM